MDTLQLFLTITGIILSFVIALLIALVNHTLASNRDQMKSMNEKLTCIDHKVIRMIMVIGMCHPEIKDLMKSHSPVELNLDPEFKKLLERYISEGVENG